MDKLLTLKEASTLLNCSRITVNRWAIALFKKNYYIWLLTPKQVEVIKEHIQYDENGTPHSGRPKTYPKIKT